MLIARATLNKLEDLELVKKVQHPEHPITLYTYTALGNNAMRSFVKGRNPLNLKQFEFDSLRLCRGLCVKPYITSEGNFNGKETSFVVTLNAPFPKFFNNFEVPSEYFDGVSEFKVSPKYDGSLVIMFLYEGEYIFHTKGSFTSEQALFAQEIFFSEIYTPSHPQYGLAVRQDGYTRLFEVIYPENKVVTDYGDKVDMHLLAIRSPLNQVEVHRFGKDLEPSTDLNKCTLEDIDLGEFEGVVVSFVRSNGEVDRVKFKRKEYFELHRLLSNFSREDVLRELILSGDADHVRNIYTDLPDEFVDDLNTYIDEYDKAYFELVCKASRLYSLHDPSSTRKELAALVSRKPEATVVFALYESMSDTNRRGVGRDFVDLLYRPSDYPKLKRAMQIYLRKRFDIKLGLLPGSSLVTTQPIIPATDVNDK